MKNLILLLLSVLLITGSFVSCKKGDHDAFLSLSSRKARLVGNWKVSNEVITEVIVNGTSTTTNNITYDGASAIISSVNVDGSLTTTFVDTIQYVSTLDIKKDGTYKSSIVNGNLLDITNTEGNWMFIGKSKINKLKNKEAILMTTTHTLISDGAVSNSVLYTDLNGKTMVLDELKKKEMIIIIVENNNNETGLESTSKTTKTTYTLK